MKFYMTVAIATIMLVLSGCQSQQASHEAWVQEKIEANRYIDFNRYDYDRGPQFTKYVDLLDAYDPATHTQKAELLAERSPRETRIIYDVPKGGKEWAAVDRSGSRRWAKEIHIFAGRILR